MANIPILSGAGATSYLKSSGAGSDADPFIPEHDVNLKAGTNNVGDIDVLSLVGDSADMDSGVGTDAHAAVAWVVPDSGGHKVVGTPASPVATDPVGSTIQPVSISSWFVGAQVISSVIGNPAVIASVAGVPNTVASVIGNPAVIASIAGVPVTLASVSGYPGVSARAANAQPTEVANAAIIPIQADLTGAIVNRPYTVPENLVSGVGRIAGGVTGIGIIAAPGASLRNYITAISVINADASVGTPINIYDGTATLWSGYAGPGGGAAPPLVAPLRGAIDATIVIAAVTASSNCYVSISGYKGR